MFTACNENGLQENLGFSLYRTLPTVWCSGPYSRLQGFFVTLRIATLVAVSVIEVTTCALSNLHASPHDGGERSGSRSNQWYFHWVSTRAGLGRATTRKTRPIWHTSFILIYIVSSHLSLGLPSVEFVTGYDNTRHAFFVSLKRAI
jgi:hypothetical protein